MNNATTHLPEIPKGLTGDALISSINDRLRRVSLQLPAGPNGLPAPQLLGDGLTVAIGKAAAQVTSKLTLDADGNIIATNGTGFAFDQTGKLTVQAGVGLGIDQNGFIRVNSGQGLAADSTGVYIPGGAITQSLLAALAVGAAQIQAGAVGTINIQAGAITTALIANAAITNALIGNAAIGTANIQNAAITNALIANLAVGDANIFSVSASKISTGTLTVGGSGVSDPFLQVLDGSNTQIGWIGQTGGNYGAWFKTCRVGGTSYAGAPLQADSSGNLTLNGGTLTATTISSSTISSSTISAGTITGSTITLNLNGVTTTLGNITIGSYTAGIRIQSNSNSTQTYISPDTVIVTNSLGGTVVQLLGGGASGGFLNVLTSSASMFTANGQSNTVTIAGSATFNYGSIAMPKVVAGKAQFSAGSLIVLSGLSSITSAVASLVNGAGSTEVVCAGTPSGGSVTFYSSVGGSTAFFSYVICGS